MKWFTLKSSVVRLRGESRMSGGWRVVIMGGGLWEEVVMEGLRVDQGTILLEESLQRRVEGW